MINAFIGDKGKGFRDITRVSLVSNVDGMTLDIECLGYIQEDPFITLTYLLNNYFIWSYNKDKWYPMFGVSYGYALMVDSVGSYYNPATIRSHDVFLSIRDFELELKYDLDKAKYTYDDNDKLTDTEIYKKNKYMQEFFEQLNQLKKENEVIQKAINYTSYMNQLKVDEDESYEDFYFRIKQAIDDIVQKNAPISESDKKDELHLIKFLHNSAIDLMD